ncbi:MAG: dihydroorotate dehydrogenase electron transfer subunit [Spirochaetes bacterium]|jgi:dihydroorotate dehydrogenase electron transfer subunit|nr:dihydroorotate dehydrogenase electron transfer subunit [Spirochaetota bacterium]
MKIISDRSGELCKDHFLLKIKADDIISYPGQFVNIRISETTDPLLRRPFSIHNHENGIIDVIFRVVGKGTGILKKLESHGAIDAAGPFGRGFTLIKNSSVLLIGGGVGNAPLYYLSRKLKDLGNRVVYLYGSKTGDLVFLREKFGSAVDEFVLATDDGSMGKKGIITEYAGELLKYSNFDRVYSCGPEIMQKTIVDLMKDKSTPVEVSLEKYFGCGYGVCYGCTVETIDGLKRTCADGPVFDGRIIKWQQ